MTTYFAVDMTGINDVCGDPWRGTGSTPEEAIAYAAELTGNNAIYMRDVVALPASRSFDGVEVEEGTGTPIWVYIGVAMTQDEYEDWTNG